MERSSRGLGCWVGVKLRRPVARKVGFCGRAAGAGGRGAGGRGGASRLKVLRRFLTLCNLEAGVLWGAVELAGISSISLSLSIVIVRRSARCLGVGGEVMLLGPGVGEVGRVDVEVVGPCRPRRCGLSLVLFLGAAGATISGWIVSGGRRGSVMILGPSLASLMNLALSMSTCVSNMGGYKAVFRGGKGSLLVNVFGTIVLGAPGCRSRNSSKSDNFRANGLRGGLSLVGEARPVALAASSARIARLCLKAASSW